MHCRMCSQFFATCPRRSKQLKLFQRCKVYMYICNSIEWSQRECFEFDVARSMISFIVRAMLVLVVA
jgi:hypothetical protein